MTTRIFFPIYIGLILGASAIHAEDTVEQLKEKIIQLQNKSPLGIKNFNYCSNVTSFGNYTPIPGNQVKAGSKMKFYFEPANLSTNHLNNVYLVNFTQDIIVLDAKNKTVLKKEEAFKINYQTKTPVMDFFVTNSLDTGGIEAGKYTFKVVLHDKLKKKDAIYSFPFEVVPEAS